MTITEIQTKIRESGAKASRKHGESETFHFQSRAHVTIWVEPLRNPVFDTAHNRMPREWWPLNFKP